MKSSGDETQSSGDETKSKSGGKKRKAEIPPTVSALQFDKKARSLMKQIYELSTLSGVPACLVIRTPEIEPYSNLPRMYTWPESIDEFGRVVDLYKSRKKRGKMMMIGSPSDQILKNVTAAEGHETENPKQDSCKEGLNRVKKVERVKVLGELDTNIEAVDGKIQSAFSSLYAKPRKIVETGIGCSGFVAQNVLQKQPDKRNETPTRMMENAEAVQYGARDLDLNKPPRLD